MEETGLEHVRLVRKLGEAWRCLPPGSVPPGFEEQVEHAFHLTIGAEHPPEEWEWMDADGTGQSALRFRWVDLDRGAEELWSSHAMWLDSLRSSIEVQRGAWRPAPRTQAPT